MYSPSLLRSTVSFVVSVSLAENGITLSTVSRWPNFEFTLDGGTAEKFPLSSPCKEGFKRSKGKVSVWPGSGARIYTEMFIPVNAILFLLISTFLDPDNI